MQLSKRLYTIAGQVPLGSRIADIGTDHGYVPIYLYLHNQIEKAIAADLHKGPLEKARTNIQAYKATHKIETRLGNGLQMIQPGEVDVIIIAGMGGRLIGEILEAGQAVMKESQCLILQPQLDLEYVRKFIHHYRFQIIEEQMVEEDGKYYTILTATPGEEKYDRSADYLFGKKLIEKKDPVLKEYIQYKLQEFNKIHRNIIYNGNEAAKIKTKELESNIGLYTEVLSWL